MRYAGLTLLSATLLLGLFLAGNANALGGRENDPARPQRVEVSGRIRLVGNNPMSMLVITGEDREWFIEPEEQQKLMDLQQQLVTVRAMEYYLDRYFANGTFAGRHYYLKNITVISPRR